MTWDDFLSAWSATLWRASWQGGLAVALVWLVCRACPAIPPRFQGWLWRLALLKFAVTLVWFAPVEVPWFAPITYAPISNAIESSTTAFPEHSLAAGEVSVIHRVSPLAILFTAWAVVVVWQLTRVVRCGVQAQRLMASCHSLDDPQVQWLVEQCSRELNCPQPRVLELDSAGSPFLVGILRPAIVLPRETLAQLLPAERELVIRHELAHAVRRDLAWSLLAAVVRAVLFFHPLVWVLERRLAVTQELAADDLALRSQRQVPWEYAAQLVSIVSKLGSTRPLPVLSASIAGNQHSLQQRLSAMKYVHSVSRRAALSYAALLLSAALLGIVPWRLVAADPAVAGPVQEMTTGGRGKFISFKDGTLLLRANSGATLSWSKLPEIKAVRYDADKKGFQPAGGADAFADVQAGAWIQVGLDKGIANIRIGERKGKTTGTFVSFKEQRLLILGKDLGESFVKKYGNSVHFHRFADGVPVYESVDGGEYKLIGPAEKVLGDVKEGTVLAVHAEGDDNITLIQIGTPKAK